MKKTGHSSPIIVERESEPMCTRSPITSPTCTVADLVTLLRSLPTPDPGFWDEVEAATRQYPELPTSPWER